VLQYNDFERLLDKHWNSSSGEPICIKEILSTISKNECEIYVGSDTNPARIPIVLAVSIAIIKKGEFAKFYYVKLKPWKDKRPSLQQRLQSEVAASCFIANEIREFLPDRQITVHADINPDLKTASGKYAKQLKNYIAGYGFIPIIKPMSWAASCIADRYAC
tara:strand:- start:1124 stop:1609 length:486 start_codon:yes stop_codon:yes gene_type:complete